MRSAIRAIAVPACVVVIGAVVIFWRLHTMDATDRRLAEEARVAQLGANQGDANAQYDLGRMYFWGRGMPQDFAEANSWYQKAAAQGSAKAKYAIGDLYYYGDGVPQSYPGALAWYRKAADQGDSTAEHALGLMNYYGHGLPQNYPDALAWYEKSADHGDAKSEYAVGYMYGHGLGVAEDSNEADRWYHKAASHGDRYAQEALGLRFYPLGTWSKISAFAYLAGGLWLLLGISSPRRFLREREQPKFFIAGLVFIVKGGMTIFAHSEYCLFPNLATAIAYQFTISFLTGMIIALCVTFLWPRAAKILFISSGILVVVIGALFCVIVRFDMSLLIAFRWRFVICSASLIGIAIPAAFWWWRSSKDSEIGASEPPAENGEVPNAV